MPPKRNKHPKDGDNKKDGDKKDPKKKNHPIEKRAARDIRLSIHPLLAALARQRKQTTGDYREQMQRSNSIFGQELQGLKGLAPQYNQGSKAILGNLADALGAFGGTTGGFGAENAAAGNAMNAGASGALGVLGAGQASDLAALQATRAAAGMQRQEMGTDILANRQDALDQLMMQKQDILGQIPALTNQRLDELRDQFFERNLAKQQFKLNKKQVLSEIAGNEATSDFLRQYIENLLNGGGGGNFHFDTTGGGGGGGGGTVPGGGPAGGGGVGPNTPGGRDTAGHGGGPQQPSPAMSALQAFVSGQRGWQAMADQGHQNVREGIANYYRHHQQDPAFTQFNGPHPGAMNLINAIRDFYYRKHTHKDPL